MELQELPKLNHLKGQRIALLGCGDIGCRLAKRLLKAGAAVKAYRRDITDITDFPAEAVDFSHARSLENLSKENFDYAVITLTPDRSCQHRAEAYQVGYVDNLNRILQALNLKTLKKLIWVSSTSVYAQTDGARVDETSDTAPNTTTGEILLKAEALLSPLGNKATTVRFSGIYRSEKHRYLDKLLAGELPEKAHPNFIMNRIHVDDCAGILGFLLDKHASGKPIEHLYIGTDNQPIDYQHFVAFLSEQLQQPLNTELSMKAPSSSKYLQNKRLLDAGYTFLYPTYQDGFRTLVNHYKNKE